MARRSTCAQGIWNITAYAWSDDITVDPDAALGFSLRGLARMVHAGYYS